MNNLYPEISPGHAKHSRGFRHEINNTDKQMQNPLILGASNWCRQSQEISEGFARPNLQYQNDILPAVDFRGVNNVYNASRTKYGSNNYRQPHGPNDPSLVSSDENICRKQGVRNNCPTLIGNVVEGRCVDINNALHYTENGSQIRFHNSSYVRNNGNIVDSINQTTRKDLGSPLCSSQIKQQRPTLPIKGFAGTNYLNTNQQLQGQLLKPSLVEYTPQRNDVNSNGVPGLSHANNQTARVDFVPQISNSEELQCLRNNYPQRLGYLNTNHPAVHVPKGEHSIEAKLDQNISPNHITNSYKNVASGNYHVLAVPNARPLNTIKIHFPSQEERHYYQPLTNESQSPSPYYQNHSKFNTAQSSALQTNVQNLSFPNQSFRRPHTEQNHNLPTYCNHHLQGTQNVNTTQVTKVFNAQELRSTSNLPVNNSNSFSSSFRPANHLISNNSINNTSQIYRYPCSFQVHSATSSLTVSRPHSQSYVNDGSQGYSSQVVPTYYTTESYRFPRYGTPLNPIRSQHWQTLVNQPYRGSYNLTGQPGSNLMGQNLQGVNAEGELPQSILNSLGNRVNFGAGEGSGETEGASTASSDDGSGGSLLEKTELLKEKIVSAFSQASESTHQQTPKEDPRTQANRPVGSRSTGVSPHVRRLQRSNTFDGSTFYSARDKHRTTSLSSNASLQRQNSSSVDKQALIQRQEHVVVCTAPIPLPPPQEHSIVFSGTRNDSGSSTPVVASQPSMIQGSPRPISTNMFSINHDHQMGYGSSQPYPVNVVREAGAQLHGNSSSSFPYGQPAGYSTVKNVVSTGQEKVPEQGIPVGNGLGAQPVMVPSFVGGNAPRQQSFSNHISPQGQPSLSTDTQYGQYGINTAYSTQHHRACEPYKDEQFSTAKSRAYSLHETVGNPNVNASPVKVVQGHSLDSHELQNRYPRGVTSARTSIFGNEYVSQVPTTWNLQQNFNPPPFTVHNTPVVTQPENQPISSCTTGHSSPSYKPAGNPFLPPNGSQSVPCLERTVQLLDGMSLNSCAQTPHVPPMTIYDYMPNRDCQNRPSSTQGMAMHGNYTAHAHGSVPPGLVYCIGQNTTNPNRFVSSVGPISSSRVSEGQFVASTSSLQSYPCSPERRVHFTTPSTQQFGRTDMRIPSVEHSVAGQPTRPFEMVHGEYLNDRAPYSSLSPERRGEPPLHVSSSNGWSAHQFTLSTHENNRQRITDGNFVTESESTRPLSHHDRDGVEFQRSKPMTQPVLIMSTSGVGSSFPGVVADPRIRLPEMEIYSSSIPDILDHLQQREDGCFSILFTIAKSVQEMEEDILKFAGKHGDQEYVYLEEMLTRQLLSLDQVLADGDDEIRNSRRRLVKEVQELLEILERRSKS